MRTTNRSLGTRIVHVATAVVALLACHACGGSGGAAPLTEPGPPSSFPPGCGMSLFPDAACEAYLDQVSCAQQDQCAHTPGCVRIVSCWNACEARRRALPPATGAGCDCFPNCFPQANQTPGYTEFMRIVALLQGTPPNGLSCRSGC